MPKLSPAAREVRRAQIMCAAHACFARLGFFSTTMDDVATEAGVSKGTPYLYFDSKAALFQALYEAWSCGLSERFEAALASLPESERRSPRANLRVVLRAIGEHVVEEPDACRVLLEAQAQARHLPTIAEATAASQAQTLASLERLLEAGAACGDWRIDGRADLHARLFLAAINGLMSQWHVEPYSFSWDAAATALVNELSATASTSG
jgi:AcrR family transcriptional regulator